MLGQPSAPRGPVLRLHQLQLIQLSHPCMLPGVVALVDIQRPAVGSHESGAGQISQNAADRKLGRCRRRCTVMLKFAANRSSALCLIERFKRSKAVERFERLKLAAALNHRPER